MTDLGTFRLRVENAAVTARDLHETLNLLFDEVNAFIELGPDNGRPRPGQIPAFVLGGTLAVSVDFIEGLAGGLEEVRKQLGA